MQRAASPESLPSCQRPEADLLAAGCEGMPKGHVMQPGREARTISQITGHPSHLALEGFLPLLIWQRL